MNKVNNQNKSFNKTKEQKIIFWAAWVLCIYALTVVAGSFIVSKIMNCS